MNIYTRSSQVLTDGIGAVGIIIFTGLIALVNQNFDLIKLQPLRLHTLWLLDQCV